MAAVGVPTARRGARRCCIRPRARGQPFHLVLTDALMPEVDGFSLAEQIATDYRAQAPPKIMLLTSGGIAGAARPPR